MILLRPSKYFEFMCGNYVSSEVWWYPKIYFCNSSRHFDVSPRFFIPNIRCRSPFRTSVFLKNYHFYDNNIGCSELEKYGYSERSSKNKRMFVKIFNGCSERQRHAHFCWRNWIILTDVRNENIGMFGTTINGCS